MSKIFHIGNIVYPTEIDGNQCNADKREMGSLYGVIVGLSDDDGDSRKYSVEWLDNDTDEPAEFDHGLKNSWFTANELTDDFDKYMALLDKLSFKKDGEVLDEIVTELCDVIDDRLIDLCNIYGLDYCEYSDIVIEKLFERLK